MVEKRGVYWFFKYKGTGTMKSQTIRVRIDRNIPFHIVFYLT